MEKGPTHNQFAGSHVSKGQWISQLGACGASEYNNFSVVDIFLKGVVVGSSNGTRVGA
ncbi:hypothetical protein COLO4_37851 [Corchorus olitorius]|uniref:Uncharacterized protein n=1 Tax=Corchorus olitorius TaxID=93759 RepID=A0A1R3FYT2_9ROSI|nr:hypothetical protein COLO4_37851 [Corchorus olitorius]